MASSHRSLTLTEKFSLIKDHANANGLSQRKLAKKYKISKGAVGNILQRKDEYEKDFAANTNRESKRKLRNDSGQKLDIAVFAWFNAQRAKNISLSGPPIKEKVRQLSEELGQPVGMFKASNGWLEKFVTRHSISSRLVCGESGNVSLETVEEWKARLPLLLEQYTEEDVYNADETGLFFKALSRSLICELERDV